MTTTARRARTGNGNGDGGGGGGGEGRDPSRDGLRNRIEAHVLTHYEPLWRAVQGNRWLYRRTNAALTDLAILKAPPRPNPLSTLAPYTSWTSLTDRSYVGRHLPPDPAPHPARPAPERAAELFRRDGEGGTCARSTALLPAFAQWFTDGFLRGHGKGGDPRRTDSPHTIDMVQLYGADPEMTACLREFEGGRLKSRTVDGGEFPPLLCDEGRIKAEFEALKPVRWEDVPEPLRDTVFASGGDRAHAHLGPMLVNVLFLREHNRIAGLLARAHRSWDDERIFQTTRNILVVMTIRLVLEEYINHLTPFHFRFRLDPSRTVRSSWYRENWSTIEFSLVYRWHALIPSAYRIAGREVPLLHTLANGRIIEERGMGPLFDDLSRQPAGHMGLFNTDPLLLPIEARSVEVGRELKVASYNDYREHFGFPRATDLRQVSGDPVVREALHDLYGGVDELDLYVGIHAEDARHGSLFGNLLGRIIGIDSFSEALTNPLLSPRLFTAETFSPEGMEILRRTRSLSDVVHRNLPEDDGRYRVSLGVKHAR
ncbi:peroxidase family protein [Streptomyces ficellus]|uniref:Heme peroxidase n=1 Tax=Streptomyces ficellus TaxID=1977088 RepID=A0A6I6FLX4_9ACTN|nr:peroxidase family protein [Streptomyces ficellus]QGV77226.1 heme peroxidase [Streptomyces ficellus]